VKPIQGAFRPPRGGRKPWGMKGTNQEIEDTLE